MGHLSPAPISGQILRALKQKALKFQMHLGTGYIRKKINFFSQKVWGERIFAYLCNPDVNTKGTNLVGSYNG
jgi:hypothetical protein